MPKILAIGGAGMLGRPVVVTLLHDHFDVRVLTTDPDRARRKLPNHVDKIDFVQGDVADRESLLKSMQGCDYVYVNLKGGPTKEEYIRVELEGAKNIYSAAREAGIKKLIQISEARADEDHSFFIVERVKVESEKVLKASGLNHVVLKPTWFCESLPLTISGHKATLIGSGKASFHFLAAADYAEIVSQCFQTDKADGKSLVIFGPERLSLREALRRFLSIAHPDVKISRLPTWVARLAAMFSFNKKLKSIVELVLFFNNNDDSRVAGDPAEADRLFGRSTTTVAGYAHMIRKIVKGA